MSNTPRGATGAPRGAVQLFLFLILHFYNFTLILQKKFKKKDRKKTQKKRKKRKRQLQKQTKKIENK